MTKPQTRKRMLLDACVLIDYWKAEKDVLRLFRKHLGELNVVSPVLNEVDDIGDADELTGLGVQILEPKLEDVMEAGAQRGQLSFPDRLSVIVAKREGYICVTNDKSLRIACEKEGIDVIWGLEMLLMLYYEGGITESAALEIAGQIRASNPIYITQSVINAFRVKLKSFREGADKGI